MGSEKIIKKVPLIIDCPVCYKNELNFTYTRSHIPYVGDIVVFNVKCNNCGFKVGDLLAVTYETKKEISEKITDNTLSDLLILSAMSKVLIPELNIEIEIRTEKGGQITTIEGLLMEIKDYTLSLLNNLSEGFEKNKAREILEIIERELTNPTGRLTVIIKDETGKSVIVPKEKWTARIEKEEESVGKIELDVNKIARETINKFLKKSDQ